MSKSRDQNEELLIDNSNFQETNESNNLNLVDFEEEFSIERFLEMSSKMRQIEEIIKDEYTVNK